MSDLLYILCKRVICVYMFTLGAPPYMYMFKGRGAVRHVLTAVERGLQADGGDGRLQVQRHASTQNRPRQQQKGSPLASMIGSTPRKYSE